MSLSLPPRYRPSRRAFITYIATLCATGGASTRARSAPDPGAAVQQDADGLSRSSEAIHQEIPFKASAHRIYAALTSDKEFDALTRLSDGAELLKAPGAKPTAISPVAGGPFTLFGGYIIGRSLELVPDQRLVQAWRVGSWAPGVYSVVSFELVKTGDDCRVVFDHRAFPQGQGAHLARGWHEHYWEPIARHLVT